MIRVTLQGINPSTSVAHHYVIAGQPVVIQQRVDTLEGFHKGAASERFEELLSNHREIRLLSAANSDLRFHDLTPLANKARRLRYWRRGRRGQFDIDGVPTCCVDFKDNHIHIMNGRDLSSQLNIEVALGPALIVLLAYQQLYCLHASSVSTPAGTIAFIAESGSGKSTLAEHQDNDWQQISDDILPLRTMQKVKLIELLADYPQLKLIKAKPEGLDSSSRPLDHIIRINPEPSEKIEFRQLSAVESMLQVVRHTVAAKIFSSRVMHDHAGFARRVSLCTAVSEVSYPRDWSVLSELRESIVEYCTTQSPNKRHA